VDQRFSLDQAAEAVKVLGNRQGLGTVVLDVPP
jgi:hypothetical protein